MSSIEEHKDSTREPSRRHLSSHPSSSSSYDLMIHPSVKYYNENFHDAGRPAMDEMLEENSMHIHIQKEFSTTEVKRNVRYGDDELSFETEDEEEIPGRKGYAFGWVEGVFVRVLLSIFSVIMFLRLNWIMGQAGLAGGLGIIIFSTALTITTTFSMSTIASNGTVKGGGDYYMVSRNLGPEIGGVVGVTYYIAQALAVALNLVGFAESITILQPSYIVSLDWDAKIWALISLFSLFGLAFLGASFEIQLQKVLLVVMTAALLSFFVGIAIASPNASHGVTGVSSSTLSDNTPAHYTSGQTWLTVFGVFFPAVTGISAGTSVSGDLKDPTSAIPKGTFLAIGASTAVYASMAILMSACFTPAFLSDYNSQIATVEVALVPGLVYAGIFSAGLSSALAFFTGAPRILMALARDDILTFLQPFKKGYFAMDEPIRGYFLTVVISGIAILTLDLNSVSPIVTNFYLVVYAVINYSVTAASWSKSPGFRPSFKYWNPWLGVLGTLQCIAAMVMTSWEISIAICFVCLCLYKYIQHIHPDVNWGSAGPAHRYVKALDSLHKLQSAKQHVKNFRPQFLVFMDIKKNMEIIKFMGHFSAGKGVMVVGKVVIGEVEDLSYDYLEAVEGKVLNETGVLGFLKVVVAPTFYSGVTALLQLSGLGKLRPNTAIFGFKEHWATISIEESTEYVRALRVSFATGHGVGILRNVFANTHQSAVEGTTIDIWWVAEDGGLTLLVPHLISRHQLYHKHCRLRVFTTAATFLLEKEQEGMESLLHAFRINAEATVLASDVAPNPETRKKYDSLIKGMEDIRSTSSVDSDSEKQARLLAHEEKTVLRLVDLIEEYSSKAVIVAVSLPLPRAGVPVPRYLAMLDMLSANRPTLLIRGNQQAVLTTQA